MTRATCYAATLLILFSSGLPAQVTALRIGHLVNPETGSPPRIRWC